MMKLMKNIWVRGILIVAVLAAGIVFLESYNQVGKAGFNQH